MDAGGRILRKDLFLNPTNDQRGPDKFWPELGKLKGLSLPKTPFRTARSKTQFLFTLSLSPQAVSGPSSVNWLKAIKPGAIKLVRCCAEAFFLALNNS